MCRGPAASPRAGVVLAACAESLQADGEVRCRGQRSDLSLLSHEPCADKKGLRFQRWRRQRGRTYLLCSPLVGSLVLVVNSAEVGNNDWNRQSNDQHPAQGANGAKYLPSNCLGHHVTITGGGKKKKGSPCFRQVQWHQTPLQVP